MRDRRRLARVGAGLAGAFLDGVWVPEWMARRAAHDLGVDPAAWLDQLARHAVDRFPAPPLGRPRQLASLLIDHLRLLVEPEELAQLDVEHRAVVTPAMGEMRWPVPELGDVGALANWFGLHTSQLEWFADVRSMERTDRPEALRHYRYRWVAKSSGGDRLIEAPKTLLAGFQRRVLREILYAIDPSEACHGFRPGRSVLTYVGPHVGRAVLIRLDLEAFFASVGPGRAHGVFLEAGYPEPVAHVLTGLVTNSAPAVVLKARPVRTDAEQRLRRRLRHPHLPQGAPTSPALANLVAWRLDRRLDGLARTFGARYTRYADDLAFSADDGADLVRRTARFVELASAIVRDEGFRTNQAKTTVATAAQRQRLGGLVVNTQANIDRRELDRLRATLHDAARNGPEAANRRGHPDFRGHLQGRIAWAQAGNIERAPKLWAMFDRIEWGEWTDRV
jgi:RNA-directed DNA polymerase